MPFHESVFYAFAAEKVVGVARFERAASWTRTKHSTKLSHTPLPTPLIIAQKNRIVKFFYKLFCNLPKKVNKAEKTAPEALISLIAPGVYRQLYQLIDKIAARIRMTAVIPFYGYSYKRPV